MAFLGGGDSDSGDSNGGEGPRNQYKKQKQKKKNIGDFSIVGNVVKTVVDKLDEASRPYNIKVRKKYISKYNTSVPPSERIDMSDEQIGSKEGLASLRETGYKTNQDRIGGGNQGNTQIAKPILGSGSGLKIQKTAVKDAPDGPTIGEMDQLEETEAERLLRNKRKGRKSTKLAQAGDELTLSKKTLLG